MQGQPDGDIVQSVDRALRLARQLREGRRLTVTAAAHELEIAPSTAHRLLSSLAHRGFAARDGQRGYVAGSVLSAPVEPVPADDLHRAVMPALRQLHETVGETVQFMMLAGPDVYYADGVQDQDNMLRVVMRHGSTIPAYCSAGGKAMLAQMSNAEVAEIYRGGLTPWKSARFTSVKSLTRHLTVVRRLGYGTSNEETERGVHGIGVNVNVPGDEIRAAITAAVPSVRFRSKELASYVEALETARERVEQTMAAQPASRTSLTRRVVSSSSSEWTTAPGSTTSSFTAP